MVTAVTPTFLQLDQDLVINALETDEATTDFSQTILMDTNQKWFSTNLVGKNTTVVTSKLFGDFYPKTWVDGDTLIDQNVTVSKGLLV